MTIHVKPRKRVAKILTPQVFSDVLDGIAAGDSAKGCLRQAGINPRVFWGYLASDADAANRYALARARGLEKMAEETLEIADEQPPVVLDGGGDAARAKVDAGFVAWQRNRIDTRKWLLSKLAPKKYGEHLDLTVGASNNDAASLSREELLALALAKPARLTVDAEVVSDGNAD